MHRLQGWTDTELNAKGLAQGKATAEAVVAQSDRIDAVYSSDLKRCMQTSSFLGACSKPRDCKLVQPFEPQPVIASAC